MAGAASALWLLEAKPFAEEDRSTAATTVKWWLKPGTYSVGRQAAGADLAVEEDKSISRKHAELIVPAAEQWEPAGEPHVLVKDRSKYGTIVSPSGHFDEAPLGPGTEGRAAPNCMLRFGFKSPFKLYHQDWVLFLSPAQREGASSEQLAAVEAAAAATGLPLTDELPDHPGTRVLVLGAAPLRIDGALLLALLRGYPAVGANWLLDWQRQRVWCNTCPQEAAYPVQLQYRDASGRLKPLPSPAAVQQVVQGQGLQGRPLLWLPAAHGAPLQEAARMLGAANSNVAASGRAVAAAKAAGAVLVRGSEADPLPAAYKRLPWTTPELLLAGIVENDVKAAVQPPASDADTAPTPASKAGKGSRGTPASRSTAGGRGKGRGRGKAAAAADGGQPAQESGSETDASEDLSLLRATATQRRLASDAVTPPAAAAAAAAAGAEAGGRQQQQHSQQDAEPVAAAAAAAAQVSGARAGAARGQAAAGGRKRRKAEQDEEREEQQQQQQQQQQQHDGQPGSEEEEAGPTPAKRRRQAAAAAPAARAPALAAAAQQQQQAAQEGWHSKQLHTGEDASPAGHTASKTAAPVAAASAAKPLLAAAGLRRRNGATAAVAAAAEAAAAAAAAAGTAAQDGGGAAEAGGGEVLDEEEEGPTRVAYLSLVVARPLAPPAAANAGSSVGSGAGCGGPDFKAFRKAGSSVAGAAVAPRHAVIPFDAAPYAEEEAVDAEAFLKAEAERRRRAQQADELFIANVKARKARQLPDPDGDAPAKGRGRGGKKAAAAAAPGQQSILGFLPAAGPGPGRGRGRGIGRGRGRGKA